MSTQQLPIMTTTPESVQPRRRGFRFGLRTLLVLFTVVAVGFGAYVYRREARRPNLEVTPDDILWATDQYIWKIDLTGAGRIYGLSIVVVGKDGEFEQVSGWMGGRELFDTAEQPLVRVAMIERDGKITGRFSLEGQTHGFDATGALKMTGRVWAGRPEQDGDFYYLASDYDNSEGFSSFSEDSNNRIALHLLRAPLP